MNKSISFNLCVDHSLIPFEDISVKFDLTLIISFLNLTFESFKNCTSFPSSFNYKRQSRSGKNSVRQVIYRSLYIIIARHFFNARIYRGIFVHQTFRDRVSHYYTFTKPLNDITVHAHQI